MASLQRSKWRVSVVWQEKRIKTSGVGIVKSAWIILIFMRKWMYI